MKKVTSLVEFLQRYLFRNKMILRDATRKVKKNSVNLHWWKPVSVNGSEEASCNLGDFLAVPVFEYLLKLNGINENTCKGTKHLYTVGSIIFMGLQNATIWGSGILYENELPFLVTNKIFARLKIKLDIRAVRGPKTREVLCRYGYDCPQIYGDPAVLMPLIYHPQLEKKYKYTVVHHIHAPNAEEGINIATSDYESFIDRLVQSELVISGSLHGIILAEAYGVPAILLREYEDMDLFKYIDYYHGTGRMEFPVADSVEQALHMEYLPIPDFTEMQQNLIKAFPVDLWNEKI